MKLFFLELREVCACLEENADYIMREGAILLLRASRLLINVLSPFQRLVEAAEEAHHQHEDNPDLQVRCKKKRKEEQDY